MSASALPASPPARAVLVTGAARRLGREISLHFARAGWDVLAHYRHSEGQARALQAEVERLGRRCHLLAADLAQPEAAPRLLRQACALHGAPPHCIINNASIFEADDALSASAASLMEHFATNTATPLLLAGGLAAALAEAGQPSGGAHSVVHVLDQKVHNLNPDYFSYTVSKLALAQGVALQAQALAPWLRVCGLSPGLMYLSGPQTQDNFERASRVNLLREPLDPAQALTGLRFDANLGILEHEISSPQPIQVDAELNQGTQPLLPHDDDINHVLDYRKVRQIIIDECTAEHVNLLKRSSANWPTA
jgi:NAD(P)-dependent dehydrogenase (short-subunit alcohol dehydrogenase family)